MTIIGSSSAIIATTRRPRRPSPASSDERVIAVEVEADGPTTKADCLNHLYDALIAFELRSRRSAKAIVLHDAEDVVHRFELRIFDGLIDRAAVIQLPVLPLVDPNSRWVAGHYCDEFAEAHIKELVVREAVGAAIPLAGVGCAIARRPLATLAAQHDGRPFAGASLTEDYEMGLRLGSLGLKTMFVRIPAEPGERGVVASRGHFPATRRRCGSPEGALARRHRLCRLGPARLERRARRALDADARPARAARGAADRRGILAAFLWSQIWLAQALGRADRSPDRSGAPHPADDQRLAARLARADARGLHGIRLRAGRGAALDAADCSSAI